METPAHHLIGSSEAARILGVSPVWVRHLVRARKLPATVLANGRRVYYRADVERLAIARTYARGLEAVGARD